MSAQRVVLSDKLVAHLRKKGLRYVLMDVAFCKSCGGARACGGSSARMSTTVGFVLAVLP